MVEKKIFMINVLWKNFLWIAVLLIKDIDHSCHYIYKTHFKFGIWKFFRCAIHGLLKTMTMFQVHGYIILGHVLEFYTWIFSIKSLNNPIPKHLKYFHAFVPDCKLNLGNLVPKSALHVIYRIYLISNYISCTVQEYFYFFITWKFCYYCYTST